MSEVDGGIYNKIISKYSKDKKKQEVYAKEKARNTIQSSRSSALEGSSNQTLSKGDLDSKIETPTKKDASLNSRSLYFRIQVTLA